LAACEGALLVVDAAQGIEAQTMANVYLALDNDLEIIPVINKIDLPNADPERVAQELEEVIGIDPDEVILASAKDNIGIDEILERIVDTVPPPQGDENAPLKALIFDSLYDSYRESNISAFKGAFSSPCGGGTVSTIRSKISSIPILSLADAKITSSGSMPMTSSNS